MAEQPDNASTGAAAPEAAPDPAPIAFAQFLEVSPPSRIVSISDLGGMVGAANNRWLRFSKPEIQLHCDHDRCGGLRTFRTKGDSEGLPNDKWKWVFVTYRCSNCGESEKTYSLAVRADGEQTPSGKAYKFGEIPVFGPRTPPRLISLIGPDKDTFLKGRQCESQNLGIGAFGYYRRVVENQKNRILGEIIRVAEKLSAPKEAISALEAAKGETQFSKAMDSVKDALPQALMINGRNPLTLLHTALSDGLHARDDSECLDIAHDIRVVLAEFSEKLAQALKDEAELSNALNRLAARKSAKDK